MLPDTALWCCTGLTHQPASEHICRTYLGCFRLSKIRAELGETLWGLLQNQRIRRSFRVVIRKSAVQQQQAQSVSRDRNVSRAFPLTRWVWLANGAAIRGLTYRC